MAEEPRTYQPNWGEKHKRHHHHSNHSGSHNKGLGGALRMKDKQAYYGLIFFLGLGLIIALGFLSRLIVNEIRSVSLDDPSSEEAVDVLGVRYVEQDEALLLSDSIVQANNLDSLRQRVQAEKHHVYRPPRKENTWYITQREWKAIWKDFKVWRWSRKNREKESKE